MSGTELFSEGELRALAHELPALQGLRTLVRIGEDTWPASQHPAWRRKRVIVNYLRKQHRAVVEAQARRRGP